MEKKRPYRDRERELSAARMRKMRSEGAEIVIPEVVDPARRAACEFNLLLWCQSYFPIYTYLPFAKYHEEIIADFQDRVLYGGQQAIAAPRGGGKDTIMAMCILWAIAYGHKLYIAYIGPNLDQAEKKLKNIKHEILHNDLLLEDFPEMCYPIIALEGAAQRAKTQRHKDPESGESYLTEPVWAVDHIIFANIRGARCAGAIIEIAGIEKGCRGLNTAGRRPDIAVLNDIETNQSARSETQQRNIEQEIDQGIAGLAGPGRPMAQFMICTIFKQGCASDKYTDRTVKPSWAGRRYKAVISMPRREDLWEKYMKYRLDGQAREGDNADPYGEEATWFYLLHKDQMDAGAEVAWPERYSTQILRSGNQEEYSALQAIYNQIASNGWDYFYSELQNDPRPEDQGVFGLNAKTVAARCGGYAQGIVPAQCVRITEGIDIGAYELHYAVYAWLQDGSSFVIDYGTVPVEAPKGDLRDPDSPVRSALEQAIVAALRMRRDETEIEGYVDSEGNRREIDLHCVDGGAYTDAVATFVRESGPHYRMIKGEGTLQGQKRYTEPVDKQKRRRPYYHYYKVRTSKGYPCYHLDSDFWKKFVQLRYAQDPGGAGATQLFGWEPSLHRLYAKHIVCEAWDLETGKFEKVGQHNHLLDASAYACAAGGMLGVRVRSTAAPMELLQQEDGESGAQTAEPTAPPARTYDHKRKMVSMPRRKQGGFRQTSRIKSAW